MFIFCGRKIRRRNGWNYILRAEDTETEWLEFKSNYLSNQDIGEYISALSNGRRFGADRSAT